MSKVTIIAEKAKHPGNLADEYLHLKAQLADLKKQEAEMQERIVATGKDVIEGNFGRVTVSFIEDRQVLDYKLAAEINLKPSVIAKCTKWQKGGYRFNVRARRGSDEKAA